MECPLKNSEYMFTSTPRPIPTDNVSPSIMGWLYFVLTLMILFICCYCGIRCWYHCLYYDHCCDHCCDNCCYLANCTCYPWYWLYRCIHTKNNVHPDVSNDIPEQFEIAVVCDLDTVPQGIVVIDMETNRIIP